MKKMIVDLQESDAWKIQLTIAINFIFSRDAEEKRVTYSKNKNISFTSCNDANKLKIELFDPFS